ncbi:hypothetical protein D3C80_1622890 [compost metagenome]
MNRLTKIVAGRSKELGLGLVGVFGFGPSLLQVSHQLQVFETQGNRLPGCPLGNQCLASLTHHEQHAAKGQHVVSIAFNHQQT